MMTAREIEEAQQRRLRQQMREQEQRKFLNPDRDFELERVWAAHVWVPDNGVPDHGEWLFAGFRRRRNRRKPQTMNRFFGKVRRQLGIDKKAPVMLMDMTEATKRIRSADQSWRFKAPAFQQRKPTMAQRTPQPIGKTTKRRAKQKAFKLSKRETKFIAIGRNPWDRQPGYLYLGPLTSEQKRLAQFEAKRLFAVYNELLVVSTSELSKPLHHAMATGKRVKAGATRIQWPEVPPTFEDMWPKFVRHLLKQFHGAISADDPRFVDIEFAMRTEWEAQGQPWLSLGWFKRQIKPWRPDTCVKKKARKTKSRRKHSASSSTKRVKRGSRSRRKSASVSVASSKRGKNTSRKPRGTVRSKQPKKSAVKRVRVVLKRKIMRVITARLRLKR